MEGNEGTTVIAARELCVVVDLHVIRRPVRWKERDGRLLLRADPALPAIAPVFGSQHELLLVVVEIAFRPAEIVTLMLHYQLFRRQVLALVRRIEVGPVFEELVAAMLGGNKTPLRVERESFAVAQPGHIALRRREMLVRLVGIVAPGA